MMVAEKDNDRVTFSVVVPKAVYDQMQAEAQQRGLGISVYARMVLMLHEAAQVGGAEEHD